MPSKLRETEILRERTRQAYNALNNLMLPLTQFGSLLESGSLLNTQEAGLLKRMLALINFIQVIHPSFLISRDFLNQDNLIFTLDSIAFDGTLKEIKEKLNAYYGELLESYTEAVENTKIELTDNLEKSPDKTSNGKELIN